MAEFTKPTGQRRKNLLESTAAVIAAGHVIASGAPELPELKKASGLDDITPEERDWAFETHTAGVAKALGDQGTQAANAKANEENLPERPTPIRPVNPPAEAKPPKVKASDLPEVHCARCGRAVDEVIEVLPQKVYVACHGQRQGVPVGDGKGPLVAFKE